MQFQIFNNQKQTSPDLKTLYKTYGQLVTLTLSLSPKSETPKVI